MASFYSSASASCPVEEGTRSGAASIRTTSADQVEQLAVLRPLDRLPPRVADLAQPRAAQRRMGNALPRGGKAAHEAG